MRNLQSTLVLAIIVLGLAACYPVVRSEGPTPEPLIPTLPAPAGLPPLLANSAPTPDTPPPIATSSGAPKGPASGTPPLSPSPTLPFSGLWPPPDALAPWGLPASTRGRVGVGATTFGSIDYAWGASPPGWWLNWAMAPQPPLRPDITFVRMIATKGERLPSSLAQIRATAAANPGSLWLIGNEPDVAWQDNATPEQYAVVYHDLYTALKEADATVRVAIGGVSQPTPLRLAYLDRVLAAYKTRYGTEMPVDIWNVHAFILREELNSWGVGIPPGMDVTQGKLYEIGEHADLGILKQQIVDFRRWMAERGQREKPLIVSEYGILMPEDYGFPPDLVKQFMTASFDYFLTAKDAALGYAADENRLVQAFCWYSTSDTVYPTPNLFDPATRAITPLGEAFKQYVSSLP